MKKSILLVTILLIIGSCATHSKLRRLYKKEIKADVAVTKETELPDIDLKELVRDTLKVINPEGKEVLIMKAVKDENGEMVANDVIKAAMVTARFRNIAERKGKVDISFNICVPSSMIDSDWQLRFYPQILIGQENLKLDPVLITGKQYRKAQLRGYQQYEKFLKSIISDSSKFIMANQLDVFIERNIPELYKLKYDSSFVSDEKFSSIFGVTERQAVEHYTNNYIIKRNERKISNKEKMFRKYVKVPIISEGLRLDTIINNANGMFLYKYTQTINTTPNLRKADVILSGNIFQEDKKIYNIPETEPLSFYISSLSSFTDKREKYLQDIIYRKAVENTFCYIDFEVGQNKVNPKLGNNPTEINRIYKNLIDIASNQKYELDSIIVVASCSPEGTYTYNNILSKNRAKSVSDFFQNKLKYLYDSLKVDRGLFIDLTNSSSKKEHLKSIKFKYKNQAENWTMLNELIDKDSLLSKANKDSYKELLAISDLDKREAKMQKQEYYKYLREKLYPRLRTVNFNFHLHRKNMIKDTIHTTVLDTTYMKGLNALNNRNYAEAIKILRPYKDFNTAIAYCSMDYNESALDILTHLEQNDKVKYMLAIIYSRKGQAQKAIQYYLEACKANKFFISRGNLDPEISVLIKQYGLNQNQ